MLTEVRVPFTTTATGVSTETTIAPKIDAPGSISPFSITLSHKFLRMKSKTHTPPFHL